MGEENIPITIFLKNWWIDCQNIVSGTLSCNNPDIEIVNDSTYWNPIGKREYAQNEVAFIINNNSRTFGDVEFELTIDSDGYVQTLYFSLRNHSSYTSITPDDEIQNMLPNSEITVFDMNGDGIDELVFTTIDSLGYGRVNLIIDEQLKDLTISNLADVNPLIADIDGDGVYEIIVGNYNSNRPNIMALEYSTNTGDLFIDLQVEVSSRFNERFHSILVNDLNADGAPDIVIASEWNDYNYIDFFEYDNGILVSRSERFNIQTTIGDTLSKLLSPIASSNIDESKENEVVFLVGKYVNTNHIGSWDMVLGKITFNQNDRGSCGWDWDISDPIGDEYNASIDDFSATDLIISNPHPNEITTNYPYIYFGVGFSRIPRPIHLAGNSFFKLYCFEFVDSNPNLVWDYDMASNDDNYVEVLRNGGSIIAGDFLAYNPGIEIVISGSEEIIDSETGQFIQYITDIEDDLGFYHDVSDLSPSVISSAIGGNTAELFSYSDNKIICYDNSKKEVEQYTNNIPGDMEVVSLVAANLSSSSSRNLVILMSDGLNSFISSILVSNQGANYTYQWKQRQGNSRKTCEYFQPFPKMIDSDYYIWNDVELNGWSKTDAYLEIAPRTDIHTHYLSRLTVKGGLLLLGEENNPINISGLCNMDTKDYWKGIIVSNNTRLTMNSSDVSNASNALSLFDSGRREIEDCSFMNNTNAISMYNSSLVMNTSAIVNSECGIELHNVADLIMGYPYVSMNQIKDNSVGIKSYSSFLYMKGGNNSIINRPWNVITENTISQYSVQENYWGSSNEREIRSLFNNPDEFFYDPWLLTDPMRSSNNSDSYFILAECQRIAENWNLAISYYEQAFADTTNVNEKYFVLSGLYDCYNQLNSLSLYKQWLIENILVMEDFNLVKSMKNTLALVNRSLSDFTSALNYYESIIDEPASYIDSCYAAIDIGFTVLESNNRARSKYLHLNPTSYESHYKLVDKLITSIRDNEPLNDSNNVSILPKLNQNYPNPFNPSTTISFYNPKEGKVELKIYNLKGQLVKKLIKDELGEGTHSIVWNGDNNELKKVASGVYFYRLKTNNKTLVKKCLLLK